MSSPNLARGRGKFYEEKKCDEVEESRKAISAYVARYKHRKLKPGNALSGNR